ncbi:cytochrome c1 [Enterovibrio norvegicus]|uniref:Cytochrome C n=2 Tax=Enterovibrio norvegicus TaxID=188144 RepID=A0A2N7LCI2_9GAMM|nr:cytochrome c1 [Enterovibrio norvegicus]MCC4799557.1 cytochrome c1 [Enterovibrio norvegicus]OEE51897.1 cytochrome C [Enterovibrio norvegicus]OEF52772.1 cytochrome C [Enterovibrio norvegicus]OEF57654.1 cytochrome C [Enterovibrio norvegicus]PMI31629.1 cytochrome C [Enterovibrio norvegicus]
MKKWIVILFALLPSLALAAGAKVPLDAANNDLSDKASLQNGAKLFMNYCFGCHATQYQRYERIANDLDIPNNLMMENLVFDENAKIGDLVKNAIATDDAATFFGAPAPDLTLVARVRGTDWVYTYLRSFYADPSRPFGVNNVVFPSVGMPHVLEELQGTPVKQYKSVMVDGEMVDEFVGIESMGNGELSPDEFDEAVRDLVNFLEYSGEPNKLERQQMGYWVIGFLLIFLVLTIFLKKEYWRDVH